MSFTRSFSATRRRAFALSLLLGGGLFLAGCEEQQVLYEKESTRPIPPVPEQIELAAGVVPQTTPPAAPVATAPSGLGEPVSVDFDGLDLTEPVVAVPLAGVTISLPTRYEKAAVESAMRLATYTIPATTPGGDAGELVVFYFGKGQGGSAHDNAMRWMRQFAPQTPGASPVVRYESGVVNGLTVTRAAFEGTWTQPAMGPGAPPSAPRRGWAMDALVIEGGPQGSVFIRWTGPAELMRAEGDVVAAAAASARAE
jgi:hypothetical protein